MYQMKKIDILNESQTFQSRERHRPQTLSRPKEMWWISQARKNTIYICWKSESMQWMFFVLWLQLLFRGRVKFISGDLIHNTCGQAECKVLNSSAMLNLLEEVQIKCDVHARLIFLGQSRTWLCKYSPMSIQSRSGKGHFRVEKKGEKGD